MVPLWSSEVTTEWSHGSIALFNRDEHGHLLHESQNDDIILGAMVSFIVEQHRRDYTLKRGRGVVTKKQELATSGDWIAYVNDDDEVSSHITA